VTGMFSERNDVMLDARRHHR